MIVNNSDIESIAVDPAEDDAPLLVDTDAVEPLEIAAQSFKVVARWYAQVVQVRGPVDELQLDHGPWANRWPREASPQGHTVAPQRASARGPWYATARHLGHGALLQLLAALRHEGLVTSASLNWPADRMSGGLWRTVALHRRNWCKNRAIEFPAIAGYDDER
jgi:hypothetical protein